MDESTAAAAARSDVAATTTAQTASPQHSRDNTTDRPADNGAAPSSIQVTIPSDLVVTSPNSSETIDSPPFWSLHGRSVSNVSYQSINQTQTAPITLEDHSQEDAVQTQGCWARSVTIDDYIVVSGSTGIGAYVVWNCTVDTLKGGDMNIRKRYSEFDQLRISLVKAFPHAEASIPQLPRKSVVSRFRPWFLEQRKNGLNHFMNCVLLNPEFAASPILKDFIFA